MKPNHLLQRPTQLTVQTEQPVCFCDEAAGSEKLHEAAAKLLAANVSKCAIQLEDIELQSCLL